jgi:hypothetical protein
LQWRPKSARGSARNTTRHLVAQNEPYGSCPLRVV